jgi:hypothetical protein
LMSPDLVHPFAGQPDASGEVVYSPLAGTRVPGFQISIIVPHRSRHK